MRFNLLIAFIFLFFYHGFTQTVNRLALEECYRMVLDAHPLQKQFGVLQQSSAVRLAQIDASRLPDLQWNSRARLQSDVVKFPLELPGANIPELPLYSLQSSVDAAYVIFDGGLSSARQRLERAALPAGEQALRVELEQLKPRLNELFLGVLLLREREAVLRNSLENLRSRRAAVEAGVRHGVALPGDADRLDVEVLRVETRIAESRSEQRAMLDALSAWIQLPLADDAVLELPAADLPALNGPAQRAEYRLFDLQKQHIAASEELIAASKKPRLSAWVQAGIGYPNPFNFFDNNLSPFGAAGIALSWRIHDWKQSDRDRELLSLQALSVDNQRAAFDRQLDAREAQLLSQIDDVAALMAKDEEIIALQNRILAQVQAQLERGAATATDYIEQQNALTQAQLALQNRRVQLQLTKINLLTLKGLL